MPLLKRHITALDEQAEVVASMDVGAMWDRMLGEFLDEYARLQRRGLSAAELEAELLAFIDDLSPKASAAPRDLARKSSSVAYNQGRGAALLAAGERGDIRYVVRSELLDDRTCQPCMDLDGSVVEVGTQDYYALMPPTYCDGGDRCRGFYIPVE